MKKKTQNKQKRQKSDKQKYALTIEKMMKIEIDVGIISVEAAGKPFSGYKII